MPKSPPFRNILMVGLSRGGVDARIFKGFNQFRRGAGSWLLSDSGHYREMLELYRKKQEQKPWIHGAMGHIVLPEVAEWLQSQCIPAVDVSGNAEPFGIRTICADNVAVGEMGADHFQSRHYESFLFVSNGVRNFEKERWVGFRDRLREKGREASWKVTEGSLLSDSLKRSYPQLSEDRIQDLLRNRPKPLAVLAATDHTGLLICDLARSMNLRVPEDISVLGVDDFEIVCESSEPQLSSITLPAEKIGFEAARMLDLLMKGEDPGPSLRFDPSHVHARASTELAAVEDPAVAEAIRYMRENLKQPLKLPEISSQVHMHERTFLRHFQKAIGRNPSEELQRIRLEKAKGMLLNKDVPIYEISCECGFRSPDMLTRHFKAETGLSPTEFRNLHKVDD